MPIHEPLVMIPGLMADARLFLPQMVQLGAERAVHVALATRGDTVEQMSEAIVAGLPPRFALLGHGLGGDIALEIIRRALWASDRGDARGNSTDCDCRCALAR